ncbi:MAG TPA: hypothetical protein VN256_02295 [Pyrinomonadaceae bacterium]|nr:hypothetical protein [Pyrinomonadaceae bacterium]
MKLLALVFLLSAICVAPTAKAAPTTPDSLEDFIQGTWRAQGTDPSGRHGWFQEWTFEKGKFNETGYPPLEQKGSYRVLKSQGNRLTLELYDQDGTFGTENRQLEIVINKRRGTLRIGQVGPFRRSAKS